jgi:hypothetical protein
MKYRAKNEWMFAVIAPPREVQEVRNAIKAYEKLTKWHPTSQQDLLASNS